MRALFLMAAVAGLAWADEPKPVSDTQRAEARRLVRQLGHRDLTEQLAAERRLLELGAAAVGAVKDGRTSDAERVAESCERLIVRLREDGHDRPALGEFVRVCGDSAGAMAVYRSLLKASDASYWLEKIDDDPAAAEAAYREALDALMKWHKRLPERQWGWNLYPQTAAVFLLFVGGMDAAAKVKGPTADVPAKEFQAAMQAAVWSVMQSALSSARTDEGAVSAAMLARWLAAQSRDEPKLAALFAFSQFGIPASVLPQLTAWAKDKTAAQAVRVRSMGLAAVGGVDVTATAESLLWVKDEYVSQKLPASDRGPAQTRTAQVRDIAAVHLLRARGFQPEEFGFTHEHPEDAEWKDDRLREWGENTARIGRYGFTDPAARDRAHATLKAFLALKPAVRATPLSRAVPPPPDPPELLATVAAIEGGLRAAKADVSVSLKMTERWKLLQAYPRHSERVSYEFARLQFHYADLLRPPAGSVELLITNLRDPLNRTDLRRRVAERDRKLIGRAAGHLLDAYAELLKLDLPAKRPEVPKVQPLAPDAIAKERAEFAVANTARRDARYVCDLLDARDEVVKQLRELFKDDPGELTKQIEKKLSKEAADELLKAVK